MTTRLIVQTSAWLGFMGLLLFCAAGNLRWVQPWAFLAIFAVGSVAFSVWLLRRDPALVASRLGHWCSAPTSAGTRRTRPFR